MVTAVKAAIDSADPIGLLKMGAPADEYEPEVGSIVPRVMKAINVNDVQQIMHGEFGRWFGADTAGPIATYDAPAREIWVAVVSFRRGD